LNGSGFSVEFMQKVSGPISALIYVVNLPVGLIRAMIGAIDEKKVRDEEVGAS
jgi:hypothetical protein